METIEIITEKAHDLFVKRGVVSVTMYDIAAELGISENAIYKHFESKDALVENFVKNAVKENEDACKTIVGKGNDPIIELFFTMVYAQRLYLILNHAILQELEKNHQRAYLAVKQYQEGFVLKAIQTRMEMGIKLALYQDDFDVAMMSRFFLESLLLISDKRVFSPTVYTAPDLSEEIFGHLIGGIATPSGTDLINHYKDQYRFSRIAQTLKQPFWED